MSGIVYLLRNGDLYNIGYTLNLESTIKELKPDEVLKTYETSEYTSLKARLLKRYKLKRIPSSNYFRLNDDEVKDCIIQLSEARAIPSTLSQEFMISLTGSILVALISFLFANLLGVSILRSIVYSLCIASMPMWIITLTGSFGGYDTKDLSIFATWRNRLKGIFYAMVFSIIALNIELINRFIDHRFG